MYTDNFRHFFLTKRGKKYSGRWKKKPFKIWALNNIIDRYVLNLNFPSLQKKGVGKNLLRQKIKGFEEKN